MSVTAWNESVASRSLDIEAGQAFRYTRSFTVQVDDPKTPLLEIAAAPGVKMWANHPEDTFSKALKFSVKPRGSSLLLYEVTVNYDKPEEKDENRDEKPPDGSGDGSGGGGGGTGGLPGVVWSGGTQLEAAALTVDKDGTPVTNSAGVPFPNAEYKVPVKTITCVKAFPTFAAMEADADKILGKCNAGAWANGADYEWLCTGRRWSWKSENAGGVPLHYIECSFEFSHRAGGWGQDLLDIGYSQKVDDDGNPDPAGTKLGPILGQDGKPVREPVGLDGNGIAMDPPPGPANPPKIINGGGGALPYVRADFNVVVGQPG